VERCDIRLKVSLVSAGRGRSAAPELAGLDACADCHALGARGNLVLDGGEVALGFGTRRHHADPSRPLV
jgi:hypothetical protein